MCVAIVGRWVCSESAAAIALHCVSVGLRVNSVEPEPLRCIFAVVLDAVISYRSRS